MLSDAPNCFICGTHASFSEKQARNWTLGDSKQQSTSVASKFMALYSDSSLGVVCFAISMHSFRHAGNTLDAGVPCLFCIADVQLPKARARNLTLCDSYHQILSNASESRALGSDSSFRIFFFELQLRRFRHAGENVDAGLPNTCNSERRSELFDLHCKCIVSVNAGKESDAV